MDNRTSEEFRQWRPSARGKPRAGRIEALNDGILAIVITLLVLEIRVPELHDALSSREALAAPVQLGPKLISLVLIFVLVPLYYAIPIARRR